MKKSSGQALLETLFVVVFTTVIMFAFLQICITAVDDMTLNEAAFAAVRSAAVTKGSLEERRTEAETRVKNYALLFYPLSYFGFGGSFFYSSHDAVAPYYQNARKDGSSESGEDETEELPDGDSGKSVTVWRAYLQQRDLSGNSVVEHTVKIYYYTKVMFAYLTAPKMHNRSSRYASSRNRVVVSPDQDYYDKAYPKAKKFKNYDLQNIISGDE